MRLPQRVAVRPTGELTDEGKEGDLTKQVRTTGYSLITQRLCRAELPPREAFVIAPSLKAQKNTGAEAPVHLFIEASNYLMLPWLSTVTLVVAGMLAMSLETVISFLNILETSSL